MVENIARMEKFKPVIAVENVIWNIDFILSSGKIWVIVTISHYSLKLSIILNTSQISTREKKRERLTIGAARERITWPKIRFRSGLIHYTNFRQGVVFLLHVCDQCDQKRWKKKLPRRWNNSIETKLGNRGGCTWYNHWTLYIALPSLYFSRNKYHIELQIIHFKVSIDVSMIKNKSQTVREVELSAFGWCGGGRRGIMWLTIEISSF